MSTQRYTWTGPREALEGLDVLLSEALDPPADATSLLKNDPVEEDQDTGWTLHVYFADAPDFDTLGRMAGALGAPVAETLEDRDWVAHALEGLGIVRAGAFVLYGRHDADKIAEADGIALRVEANRAFGTGHHPTTAGCLEALTGLRALAPSKVLDLGTGSGVLAMAARRLFPQADIVGTDIDADSIAHARENAATNGIDDITFAVADGVMDELRSAGPFAIVLANILAEPLMTLAPAISAVTTQNGRIVLAGLLDRQKAEVISAYTNEGLSLIGTMGSDIWPVLLFRR